VIEPVQRISSLLRAGQGAALSYFRPCNLAENAEDVLFTGKVVKERSLAYVSRVGDVLPVVCGIRAPEIDSSPRGKSRSRVSEPRRRAAAHLA